MDISAQKIAELQKLLGDSPKKILLLSHTNPDGDTIGAALAWSAYLEKLGHNTYCVAPNRYPYFLEWMTDIAKINIFKDDHDGVIASYIANADIIFCMDFNQINRLEALSEVVEANTTAVKVLIDHHLHPPAEYALEFSDIYSCSTSYIVYKLIVTLAGEQAIDSAIAESLYVGFMTDTGNFSFSNLNSDLFRACSVLIDRGGIDIPYINSAVYNNFSEGRVRLLGYVLNEKMVTMYEYGAAYVALTEAEMRKFSFIQGDSEGFVNYPLTIRGISMSAMFIENRHNVRVSLRSRGDADVNVFARRYFSGGGHRNAAGGKSFMSMEKTIEHFCAALKEYFGE